MESKVAENEVSTIPPIYNDLLDYSKSHFLKSNPTKDATIEQQWPERFYFVDADKNRRYVIQFAGSKNINEGHASEILGVSAPDGGMAMKKIIVSFWQINGNGTSSQSARRISLCADGSWYVQKGESPSIDSKGIEYWKIGQPMGFTPADYMQNEYYINNIIKDIRDKQPVAQK